uniref:Exonuclease domain-containing protein n=1 Tax=Chromera velia CCMP2878 TaxID=1169474 RepID=A0A0G4HIT7_9ALVE|eukprot:Cvel_27963.t1-p1 / transcript=Cvel_27963.t1 / gene=Cvel_27963 / organism=Chromera_velia_CCMP2878 / gene_product=Uncharacterized exonuclease C637.09, putative / transcript_product=Uncharacterized exonuclease C637.09, putative / location=Cvel_scaffold3572:865-7890(-) / protein_length=1072 / sequence_SO=supercontig / SO=protein_coding / is_pseudo=false
MGKKGGKRKFPLEGGVAGIVAQQSQKKDKEKADPEIPSLSLVPLEIQGKTISLTDVQNLILWTLTDKEGECPRWVSIQRKQKVPSVIVLLVPFLDLEFFRRELAIQDLPFLKQFAKQRAEGSSVCVSGRNVFVDRRGDSFVEELLSVRRKKNFQHPKGKKEQQAAAAVAARDKDPKGGSEEERALGRVPLLMASPEELKRHNFPLYLMKNGVLEAPLGFRSLELESARKRRAAAARTAVEGPAVDSLRDKTANGETETETGTGKETAGVRGQAMGVNRFAALDLNSSGEETASPVGGQREREAREDLSRASNGDELYPRWSSVQMTDLVGIDCEMVLTDAGEGEEEISEVARVSLVSGVAPHECLLDVLIQPKGRVTDYLTKFSGIDEHMLKGVTTTLDEVLTRMESEGLVGERTVLVGHSLENDLMCMRLVHSRILDTSLMFPHKRPPLKYSLANLAVTWLPPEEFTQLKGSRKDGKGHDPTDDARAAMRLAILKMKSGTSLGLKGPASDVSPLGSLLCGSLCGESAQAGKEKEKEKEKKGAAGSGVEKDNPSAAFVLSSVSGQSQGQGAEGNGVTGALHSVATKLRSEANASSASASTDNAKRRKKGGEDEAVEGESGEGCGGEDEELLGGVDGDAVAMDEEDEGGAFGSVVVDSIPHRHTHAVFSEVFQGTRVVTLPLPSFSSSSSGSFPSADNDADKAVASECVRVLKGRGKGGEGKKQGERVVVCAFRGLQRVCCRQLGMRTWENRLTEWDLRPRALTRRFLEVNGNAVQKEKGADGEKSGEVEGGQMAVQAQNGEGEAGFVEDGEGEVEELGWIPGEDWGKSFQTPSAFADVSRLFPPPSVEAKRKAVKKIDGLAACVAAAAPEGSVIVLVSGSGDAARHFSLSNLKRQCGKATEGGGDEKERDKDKGGDGVACVPHARAVERLSGHTGQPPFDYLPWTSAMENELQRSRAVFQDAFFLFGLRGKERPPGAPKEEEETAETSSSSCLGRGQGGELKSGGDENTTMWDGVKLFGEEGKGDGELAADSGTVPMVGGGGNSSWVSETQGPPAGGVADGGGQKRVFKLFD